MASKVGRPPKDDGEKHVRPGLSWSPRADRLARQLKDRAQARGERVSLGGVVERALELLAEQEGLAL